jgi:hypothetical protein
MEQESQSRRGNGGIVNWDHMKQCWLKPPSKPFLKDNNQMGMVPHQWSKQNKQSESQWSFLFNPMISKFWQNFPKN